MLYLNNIPASDVGVVVEHRPARPVPRRQTLRWDVPGRGPVVRELDVWDNVTLEYELAVLPLPGMSLAATADLAVAWLNQGGSMRLYDDTDPDVFYLVSFPGGSRLDPVLHRGRRARVSFDANPRRFLLSGESPVAFDSGGTLVNPTPYRAEPLLLVTHSDDGSLTIGGLTLYVGGSGVTIIDTATRSVSPSAAVISGSFPALRPGANAIVLSGGVSAVKITPRWYMI